VLISLFCGAGKTYTGIRLASVLGMKTAVLAHRSILIDQWEESITKFSDAKVQRVGTDGILDPQADFYIFNIAYVHKQWDPATKSWGLKKLGGYKSIGTVIVDEAHIACAAEMAKSLLYFWPRHLIALTATPNRRDGMDKILELYFGQFDQVRITRIAQNPFTVYKLLTGVKPEFKKTSMGKKDWNSVISSLVENVDRNELIVGLCKRFSQNFNILVLTKRKDHCAILKEALSAIGITSTVMVGTTRTYDKTAQVLLSTYSKLGVGFDDARLNMLIVACSVTEVEQYAGRLRDGKNKQRVIIDLVDEDYNCKNHWKARREWYVSRKGLVKNFYTDFPAESNSPVPVASPVPVQETRDSSSTGISPQPAKPVPGREYKRVARPLAKLNKDI
jgi:hypothetical protein